MHYFFGPPSSARNAYDCYTSISHGMVQAQNLPTHQAALDYNLDGHLTQTSPTDIQNQTLWTQNLPSFQTFDDNCLNFFQTNNPLKEESKKRILKAKRKSMCKSSKQLAFHSSGSVSKNQLSDRIKEKVEISIEESKCIAELMNVKYDKIYAMIFRTPNINLDCRDWKLNRKTKRNKKARVKGKRNVFPQIKYNECPTQLSQNKMQNLFQQLCLNPIDNLQFGKSLLNFDKVDFCEYCDWNHFDINQFMASKSYETHSRVKHGFHLCCKCGESLNSRFMCYQHKKDEKCTPLFLQQRTLNKSKTNLQILQLLQQVQAEELFCSICSKYAKQNRIGNVKFAQHLICQHGEYRFSQTKFYQMDLERAFQELNADDLAILCKHQFLRQDSVRGLHEQVQSPQLQTELLLMTYQGRLRAVLSFAYTSLEQNRICTIFQFWQKQEYILDLAIILRELIERAQKKRVGIVFLRSNENQEWYFNRLNFQRCLNPQVDQIFRDSFIDIGSSFIMKCITIEYLRSFIPPSRSLILTQKSNKAEAMRIFIQQLKYNEILKDLEDYLQIQMEQSPCQTNSSAVPTDQAITPKQVFRAICQRINKKKFEMFDLCQFQTDWNHAEHFNGLTDEPVGQFLFVNPPFSVGVWFATKIIIEFLKGRNVIAILPELSTENSFGSMLFRMLGSVYQVGLIPFENYKYTLTSAVSIVILLQPDYMDALKSINTRQADKNGQIHKEQQKVLENLPNNKAQKVLLAQNMISQNYTYNQIHKCTHLSKSTIAQLKKENLAGKSVLKSYHGQVFKIERQG